MPLAPTKCFCFCCKSFKYLKVADTQDTPDPFVRRLLFPGCCEELQQSIWQVEWLVVLPYSVHDDDEEEECYYWIMTSSTTLRTKLIIISDMIIISFVIISILCPQAALLYFISKIMQVWTSSRLCDMYQQCAWICVSCWNTKWQWLKMHIVLLRRFGLLPLIGRQRTRWGLVFLESIKCFLGWWGAYHSLYQAVYVYIQSSETLIVIHGNPLKSADLFMTEIGLKGSLIDLVHTQVLGAMSRLWTAEEMYQTLRVDLWSQNSTSTRKVWIKDDQGLFGNARRFALQDMTRPGLPISPPGPWSIQRHWFRTSGRDGRGQLGRVLFWCARNGCDDVWWVFTYWHHSLIVD